MWPLGGDQSAVLARLARLEQKIDLIMAALGIEAQANAGLDEVRSLAKAGRTIEAIKTHRQLTGSSLAEAKAFVDQVK
jgi:ribosomal protein L7/L12